MILKTSLKLAIKLWVTILDWNQGYILRVNSSLCIINKHNILLIINEYIR